MALHFYVVPVTGAGTMFDQRRPAYMPRGATAMDYGREPWMLSWADVSAAEHAAIAAHADVTVIPANLDAQVGGALAAAQAQLEAMNLPAHWVTAAMTWRTVLKRVISVLMLMEAFDFQSGVAERLFALVSLNSAVGEIPVGARQKLIAGAQSLKLDTSGITLAMTVRAALVALAQQMTLPLNLRGEIF